MDKLFINKYKPKNIDDLIFEDSFKKILKNLIDNEILNIIISGNNSCGKTTIIKLLINSFYKNINISDNLKDNNILYIHETKDQGIHYFRNELHLFCKTCSTIKNKKKIVVLDDFDLINEQSQQVFRNLIDTYSSSIIFIMSCTNIHKIINSIQSRQLILNIPPIDNTQMINLCKKIINSENIKISDDLLNHIVLVSNNSIIRILNYLQKCHLINKELNITNSKDIMTHVDFEELDKYFIFIKESKIYDAINVILSLIDKGYSVIDILDSFYIYLKDQSYNTLEENEKYLIIFLICKYITIFYDIHENDIELVFLTNNIYKTININS